MVRKQSKTRRLSLGIPVAVACLVIAMSAASGASAVTVGHLAPAYSGNSCGTCSFFAKAGTGYDAPSDGIITSYLIQIGSTAPSVPGADTVTPYLVHKAGAKYRMGVTVGTFSLFGNGANSVASIPVRQAVKAGDTIGDIYTTSVVAGTYTSGAASDAIEHVADPDPPAGTLFTPEYELASSAMNLQAVIEPDADGDGYGDQTQDLCPIDPTVHAACTKPTISSFRFFHSKFYLNKSATPIIASTPPKGSTMSLNLSLASTVSFTVNKRISGRSVGGKCVRPTSKNHSKKSCTYDVKQWSFSKTLPAGVSSIAFPGTAKVNGHTKSLTVGNYDASAVAISTFTSTTGDASTAKFSILSAPKSSHH